jgi:hypothetical protein
MPLYLLGITLNGRVHLGFFALSALIRRQGDKVSSNNPLTDPFLEPTMPPTFGGPPLFSVLGSYQQPIPDCLSGDWGIFFYLCTLLLIPYWASTVDLATQRTNTARKSN